ncbi:beta-aspartyl-dipeptidase (metallo-type) [Tindallia magadiensis]|uniref:Isoaspartyl dipeptidase n=1 Tax=Tindallia magadiensis TaxID=69895 RepID=A0A1I3BYJ4_9FIRM|nr:beta-aspartyl-peptidase [Tindallia magadiensis]SFH67377.1 beta-aspartyl-dipeptidase (metallo-type) [Tindallia magadiensis]
MLLIRNVEVYQPSYMGRQDVLMAGDQILAIQKNLELGSLASGTEVIEAEGQILLPGFIDTHVHITGGGGEGGPHTRTPPIQLTDLTKAGVTTVVGCLGTDGFTRSMKDLLAKAAGLEEEGIRVYAWTGSYQMPVRSLFDHLEEDLLHLPRVIGVGEVALSDHRSSQPTVEEVKKLAASARVGGMLSGKPGLINFHLGDQPGGLSMLMKICQDTHIPLTQFLPTHQNRNEDLFQEALAYGKAGGYMDFTTSTVPAFIEEGEVPCHQALARALDAGISIEQISFSSDAQGSLPVFDKAGKCIGLEVGSSASLFQAVLEAVRLEGISLETALQTITSTPAKIMNWQDKGVLQVGGKADAVLFNVDEQRIETVIAKGEIMIQNQKVVVKGVFE